MVGGLAGSFAVLAGAAAVDPLLQPAPVILAIVLFLWTPPHFWSLALANPRRLSARRRADAAGVVGSQKVGMGDPGPRGGARCAVAGPAGLWHGLIYGVGRPPAAGFSCGEARARHAVPAGVTRCELLRVPHSADIAFLAAALMTGAAPFAGVGGGSAQCSAQCCGVLLRPRPWLR